MKRLRWSFWLLGVVAAGLIVWFSAGSLLAFAGRWLDAGEAPQKADYALVLGGDENVRPFVAAALWRAGYVRRILVSRVADSPAVEEGLAAPTHEVIRRVLQVRDVPEANIIVLDTPCSTTRDEAVTLARYLEREPSATVLVVTNDFHTRRARWVIRKSLGDRASQATMISAPTEAFPLDSWWRSQAGFRFVVNEYLRLTAYVVLYDRRVAYIGAVLLILAVVAVVGPRSLRAFRKARLRRAEKLPTERQLALGRQSPPTPAGRTCTPSVHEEGLRIRPAEDDAGGGATDPSNGMFCESQSSKLMARYQ